MDNRQTNIQQGSRVLNSSADLTGKELYLAKITDGGSIPELTLPAAVTDLALYIIDDGAAEDENSSAIPLMTGELRRIVAKGAGSAGAKLCLADPATPADAGKVRVLPAAEGYYFSPGIAMEDFADGQHVLVLVNPTLAYVATAFTTATPAATAATNSTPYGYSQAQADAILTFVREARACLIAQGFKLTNA